MEIFWVAKPRLDSTINGINALYGVKSEKPREEKPLEKFVNFRFAEAQRAFARVKVEKDFLESATGISGNLQLDRFKVEQFSILDYISNVLLVNERISKHNEEIEKAQKK